MIGQFHSPFSQMFRRCLTPLCILILILICMVSTMSSSPLGHRGALSFSNSLRLTRAIRARVQQVLSRYKQQLFGDELFEYRELMLSTLPAVTVSYRTWLHMQDNERLHLASHNLQTFWTHLEGQRQQLEREKDATKERGEQRRGKRGKPQPNLCQRFVSLQIDLRDLMKQVNSQVHVHTSETSRWIQHLRGYVILRDLERYLSRLARDYAVLQAKH
uniref:Cardiotrophin-2-like n=2 Tax=Sinocyclocheilus anshuiensis TaxID=1608454 RepID=A0A671S7A2_9TELE